MAQEHSTRTTKTVDTATDAIIWPSRQAAEPTGSKWLLDRSRVSSWARSSWIIYGYRPLKADMLYCLGTVFAIHNETGNIWSHLLGAVMFILLYIKTTFSVSMTERMNVADYLLLNMFFFGVVTCLTLSATFHTFGCHSLEVSKFFSKLDYVGITLLICCSFVPWLYYAFFNSPAWRIIYIAISLFFAIGCIIVSLCDRFGERKYLTCRALVFLGDGLSAIIPAFHWILSEVLNRKGDFLQENHLPGILATIMGACYTIGGLLYMLKFPERLYPGTFDLWFHSHQLFHVLVVIAALLYYHSLTQIMYLRLNDPGHYYN